MFRKLIVMLSSVTSAVSAFTIVNYTNLEQTCIIASYEKTKDAYVKSSDHAAYQLTLQPYTTHTFNIEDSFSTIGLHVEHVFQHTSAIKPQQSSNKIYRKSTVFFTIDPNTSMNDSGILYIQKSKSLHEIYKSNGIILQCPSLPKAIFLPPERVQHITDKYGFNKLQKMHIGKEYDYEDDGSITRYLVASTRSWWFF